MHRICLVFNDFALCPGVTSIGYFKCPLALVKKLRKYVRPIFSATVTGA